MSRSSLPDRQRGVPGDRDALGRLARSLDPHDADDLVQDTLLAALRRPPPASVPRGPWLRGVLHNLWRTRARGERRRRSRELAVGEPTEQLSSPERLAQDRQLRDQVRALLEELPEELRTTVELRYFEGLNATEIGRQQGIPAGTVRRRLKTAMDRLRERDPSHLRGGALASLPPSVLTAQPVGAVAGVGMKVGLKLAVAGAVAVVGALIALLSLPPRDPAGPVAAAAAAGPASREGVKRQAVAVPERDADDREARLAAAMELNRLEQRQARARRDALLKAIGETLDRKKRSAAGSRLEVSEPQIDPEYIRERVREDLIPHARGCYNQVLLRDGDYGGKIVLDFTIVADEELGGVVESVELGADTTIDDPTMLECMQDATYTLIFDPPEAGGRVQVSYPMLFEPGD